MVRDLLINKDPLPPKNAGSNPHNFKTKLCQNHAQGTCTFGERCHFAHGDAELRKPSLPAWFSLSVLKCGGSGDDFCGLTFFAFLLSKKNKEVTFTFLLNREAEKESITWGKSKEASYKRKYCNLSELMMWNEPQRMAT